MTSPRGHGCCCTASLGNRLDSNSLATWQRRLHWRAAHCLGTLLVMEGGAGRRDALVAENTEGSLQGMDEEGDGASESDLGTVSR